MRKLHVALVIGAVVLIGTAGAMTFGKTSGLLGAKQQSGMEVVATVDGYKITSIELAPMIQQGMDRASALDRRITQSVIAKAAEADYAAEAKVLMDANRNDILFQLYLSKRTEAIKKAVTDTDIKAFYDKNVKDEDYRNVVLKRYLTNDAREAQAMYDALAAAAASRDKDMDSIAAKMTYLQKDGDHYIPLQQVPYNLGQVIKPLKPGEFTQPMVVREGVVVLYLEAAKQLAKPTLEKTKDEIRQLIMQDRLGEEIAALRKAATISLKG